MLRPIPGSLRTQQKTAVFPGFFRRVRFGGVIFQKGGSFFWVQKAVGFSFFGSVLFEVRTDTVGR